MMLSPRHIVRGVWVAAIIVWVCQCRGKTAVEVPFFEEGSRLTLTGSLRHPMPAFQRLLATRLTTPGVHRWEWIAEAECLVVAKSSLLEGAIEVRVLEYDPDVGWNVRMSQAAFAGLSDLHLSASTKKNLHYALEVTGLNGWSGDYVLDLETRKSVQPGWAQSLPTQAGVYVLTLSESGRVVEVLNQTLAPGFTQRPVLHYETFDNQGTPWELPGSHPAWFLIPQAVDGRPNMFSTAGTDVEHWVTVYSTNHYGRFKLSVPTLFGNASTGVQYVNNPDKDQCYWVAVDTRGRPGLIRFQLRKLKVPPNDEVTASELIRWNQTNDLPWGFVANGDTTDATMSEEKSPAGSDRYYLESALIQGKGNSALGGRSTFQLLRSVWYEMRPPATGRYVIELEGGVNNNFFQIFEGDSLAAMKPVSTDSLIYRRWTGDLRGGVDYRVAVMGVRNEGGPFALKGSQVPALLNHAASAAVGLRGLRQPIEASALGAMQIHDRFTALNPNLENLRPSASLWWSYDSPSNQNVFVDTLMNPFAHFVEVLEFPLGRLDPSLVKNRVHFMAQNPDHLEPAIVPFRGGFTYLIRVGSLEDRALKIVLSLEPEAYLKMRPQTGGDSSPGRTRPSLEIRGMPASRVRLERALHCSDRNMTWITGPVVTLDREGLSTLVLLNKEQQEFWRVLDP